MMACYWNSSQGQFATGNPVVNQSDLNQSIQRSLNYTVDLKETIYDLTQSIEDLNQLIDDITQSIDDLN